MWYILALCSALIYSTRTILEKQNLSKIDKYSLAFGLRLFALPFFFIPIIFQPGLLINPLSLNSSFWIANFWNAAISSPLEIIFLYKALQISEVSYLIPILSFAPILTTIFDIIIFGTYPSLLGLLAITLVIVGVYILNVTKSQSSIFSPFTRLGSHQGVKYISVMLLLYSMGVTIDKFAIGQANPQSYAIYNYLTVTIALYIINFFKHNNPFALIKQYFPTFIVLGFIVFAYTYLRNLALDNGQSAYVAAILATSTLYSTFLGIFILKEKANYGFKILGATIATFGMIIFKLL